MYIQYVCTLYNMIMQIHMYNIHMYNHIQIEYMFFIFKPAYILRYMLLCKTKQTDRHARKKKYWRRTILRKHFHLNIQQRHVHYVYSMFHKIFQQHSFL